MTGGITRQSPQRLLNCCLSRSDGRGQGRPQPASVSARTLDRGPARRLPATLTGTNSTRHCVRFDGGNSTPVICLKLCRAPVASSKNYSQGHPGDFRPKVS
jgi:hypothetical protein